MNTPESCEHSGYEIYYKYLSVKRRGTPLWEPGPQLRLPREYREKGVSNGDVGTLNPTTGIFTFLFNVFLSPSHDINRGRVPDDFIPLDQYKAEKNMRENEIYDRCLMSSSLSRTDSSDFAFQTTGREGAVLVIPGGGLSEDLQNYKLLKNYIATYCESWWQYVESEDCGVPIENGIQVIVGTDKVSSWGMATFENVEEPIQFEFKGDGTPLQTWTWKRINGRAGPTERERQGLLAAPNSSFFRNQCVFVRTLNVSVPGKDREKLAVEVCSSCSHSTTDSSRREGQPRKRNVEIRASEAGPSGVSHPSKLLNKYLLEKYPTAKVVITSDSDWISVITENDTTMPSVEDICIRVLSSHLICEEEGVVTLENQVDISAGVKGTTRIMQVGNGFIGVSFHAGPLIGPSATLLNKQASFERLHKQAKDILGEVYDAHKLGEIHMRRSKLYEAQSDFEHPTRPHTSSSLENQKPFVPSISEIVRKFAPPSVHMTRPYIARSSSLYTPSSHGHSIILDDPESDPEIHPTAATEEEADNEFLSRSSIDSVADEVQRTIRNHAVQLHGNQQIPIAVSSQSYAAFPVTNSPFLAQGVNNNYAPLSLSAYDGDPWSTFESSSAPTLSTMTSADTQVRNHTQEAKNQYSYQEQLTTFYGGTKLPMDIAGPFIPQQMYRSRTKANIDGVLWSGPLFFYSDNPTRCGIPLKDALLSSNRLHDRDKPVFEDCSPRVSIRLQWPGYKPWSKQIPTKDLRHPSRPMTLAKLAKWVARCVQRFIKECKFSPVEAGFHHWRVGDDRIRFEDLMLVSLHHVSLESWQPQLRLASPNEPRSSRPTTVTPLESHSEDPSKQFASSLETLGIERTPTSRAWESERRSQSPATI